MTSALSPLPSSSFPFFSRLPEELQLEVFRHLPLQELLTSDEVCRGWGRLKVEALKRRHHLYLVNTEMVLDSLQPPEYYGGMLSEVMEEDGVTPLIPPRVRLDRHAFITGHENCLPSTTQLFQLMELMPNIQVLRISLRGDQQELWKISSLLSCYRKVLKELTVRFSGIEEIYGSADDRRNLACISRFTEQALAFLNVLNSCEQLNSLELHLSLPSPPGPWSFEVHLPIASRLKVLKLRTISGFQDKTAAIQNLFAYADEFINNNNNNEDGNYCLEELYLDDTKLPLELVAPVMGRCAALARSLRHLDLSKTAISGDDQSLATLHQLVTRCPNLQKLYLTLNRPSEHFLLLAEALQPCINLLCLEIASKNIEYWGSSEYRPLAQQQLHQQQQQPRQLPVLPSVKSLMLAIETAGHRDWELLGLGAIFPSLQVATLRQDRVYCPECSPSGAKLAKGHPLMECFRQEQIVFFQRLFPLLTTVIVQMYTENVEFQANFGFLITRDNFANPRVIPYEDLEPLEDEEEEESENEHQLENDGHLDEEDNEEEVIHIED